MENTNTVCTALRVRTEYREKKLSYLLYMIIILRWLNPVMRRKKRGFKPIRVSGGAPASASTKLPSGCARDSCCSLQPPPPFLCPEGRAIPCQWPLGGLPTAQSCLSLGVAQVYTNPRLPLQVRMSEHKQAAELQ